MVRCLLLLPVLFLAARQLPALSAPGIPEKAEVSAPLFFLSILADSYPGDVLAIGFDPDAGDWFLRVNTSSGPETLYWASGRLLPQSEPGTERLYTPFFSYYYPSEVPDPADFSAALIQKLRSEGEKESRAVSLSMCSGFFDFLYNGESRNSIEQHIERVDFLGTRVTVHRKIVPALKRAEDRIRALEKTDKDVRRFTSAVLRADGYAWRDIRDTSNRSLHSWALAVDILPVKWGSLIVYWQWAKNGGEKDWMNIPLSRRWMPPPAVIEAFEAEGFIWGGKWDLWDNMHFEYRPEMLLLRSRSPSADAAGVLKAASSKGLPPEAAPAQRSAQQ